MCIRDRDVTLAGELLAEIGRERLTRLGSKRTVLWEQTIQALVIVLEHLDPQRNALIPTIERIRSAQALGVLGDPRYPVTNEQWYAQWQQHNRDFGEPNGYFCYVPAGSYQIGGWNKPEKAANLALHEFWIARLLITVDQYHAFIEAGGYTTKRWWTPEGWRWKGSQKAPWYWDNPQYTQPNQPVSGVTWYACMAYCNWLSEHLVDNLPEGYVVSLPTEAEWETAAAWDGTDKRRIYPWGADDPTTELAVYDELKLTSAAPVGCCPAGVAACGVIDLAGNVWEWCTNSYQAYPDQAALEIKDFTRNDGDVPFRRGSYYENSTYVRCGARKWDVPGGGYGFYGFRIVVAPRLNR